MNYHLYSFTPDEKQSAFVIHFMGHKMGDLLGFQDSNGLILKYASSLLELDFFAVCYDTVFLQ